MKKTLFVICTEDKKQFLTRIGISSPLTLTDNPELAYTYGESETGDPFLEQLSANFRKKMIAVPLDAINLAPVIKMGSRV